MTASHLYQKLLDDSIIKITTFKNKKDYIASKIWKYPCCAQALYNIIEKISVKDIFFH